MVNRWIVGGPHCWWSLVIIWMDSWLVLIQCIFYILMLPFPGLSDTCGHFLRVIIHNGGFCVSCVVPVGKCPYVLGAPGSGPFSNVDMSYVLLCAHTSYFCVSGVLEGYLWSGVSFSVILLDMWFMIVPDADVLSCKVAYSCMGLWSAVIGYLTPLKKKVEPKWLHAGAVLENGSTFLKWSRFFP